MLAMALAAALAMPLSPLEGEWKTGCMATGQNGSGVIATVVVKGDTIVVSGQFYKHDRCDTPTMLMQYRGTLLRTDPTEGGVAFDTQLQAVEITIEAPEILEAYNRPGSGCGFGGDWVIGKPRDVTGRTCASMAIPAAGIRLYDRAWIAGGTLRVGVYAEAWSNAGPEKRATTPGSPVFNRVEPGQ